MPKIESVSFCIIIVIININLNNISSSRNIKRKNTIFLNLVFELFLLLLLLSKTY